MKKLLMLGTLFLTGLILDVGMSFAKDKDGVPGPADSETGLAGLVMAGGATYLVWRRRKA